MAKVKSQVPVWQEGLVRTALSADYQCILAALVDRGRLGLGPLTCRQTAILFCMDGVGQGGGSAVEG
ncbi:hypothetical protein ACN6K8_000261 [[Kitasatospora] papulosa]|uniref:hypothetical protein n=1 Tax=Streptomyces TaxID=1883 RepID=UPI003430BB16